MHQHQVYNRTLPFCDFKTVHPQQPINVVVELVYPPRAMSRQELGISPIDLVQLWRPERGCALDKKALIRASQGRLAVGIF